MALGNEQLMTLFEREARMAGHLTHENIANVMDAGRTADGLSYIAMEWLEGSTLEDILLAEAPMSFERAGGILYQIAAALDAAHSQRIVHRDLKPSNVMLIERHERGQTGSPQVKVLDFGIAKVVSETTAAAVSAPMGTPHYASPEQFRLGGHIDGRADIYSLGVVLYRMLSGEVPFQTTSMHELVQRQLNDPPPPLRIMRKDVPDRIEKLVNRMLAKEPDERPQSASSAAAEYLDAIGMTPSESREITGQQSRESTHGSICRQKLISHASQALRSVRSQNTSAKTAPEPCEWHLRRCTYCGEHALLAILISACRRSKADGVCYFRKCLGDSQLDVLERVAPQLLVERLSCTASRVADTVCRTDG